MFYTYTSQPSAALYLPASLILAIPYNPFVLDFVSPSIHQDINPPICQLIRPTINPSNTQSTNLASKIKPPIHNSVKSFSNVTAEVSPRTALISSSSLAHKSMNPSLAHHPINALSDSGDCCWSCFTNASQQPLYKNACISARDDCYRSRFTNGSQVICGSGKCCNSPYVKTPAYL